MEIIQQKLIWLMGIAASLVIIFKLDLERAVTDHRVAIKLKTGIILQFAGAVFGIFYKMRVIDSGFLHAGGGFVIETLIGCVLGWTLIVWGLLEWSKEYYDLEGKPLMNFRYRRFSEKVSLALIREQDAVSFLDEISKYLLLALDCQALSLHRKDDGGQLYLNYQRGLTDETIDFVKRPAQYNNIFYAAYQNGQTVASDDPQTIHNALSAQTMEGAALSVISAPVNLQSEIEGVITLYSARLRRFGGDDIQVIRTVCSALAMILRRENAVMGHYQETGFREMLTSLNCSFEFDKPLISSVLKSSRLLYNFIPCREMNLFLSADGPVESYDFQFPGGGRLNIHRGYFSRSEYPQLGMLRGNRSDRDDERLVISSDQRLYQVRIGPQAAPDAYLEVRFDEPLYAFRHFAHLVNALGQLIARKLLLEKIGSNDSQVGQWFGALRYFQERALENDNLSELLHESANLVVNCGLSAFCRIALCDPSHTVLKTAALAQVRPLNWSAQYIDQIKLDQAILHHRVLQDMSPIHFDQVDGSKIDGKELGLLFPAGVQNGSVIPLAIDGHAVGLLTAGDFRNTGRGPNRLLSRLFLADLAGLISLTLAWHKEKRVHRAVKEGNKRLTMMRQKEEKPAARVKVAPQLRSRLNGPLAGILASCEYLKDSHASTDMEMAHYLNVIERNATKIHEITAGMKSGAL